MSLPSSQIIQQPLPDWFSTFRLFINQSQVFCAHRQWMLEMPFFLLPVFLSHFVYSHLFLEANDGKYTFMAKISIILIEYSEWNHLLLKSRLRIKQGSCLFTLIFQHLRSNTFQWRVIMVPSPDPALVFAFSVFHSGLWKPASSWKSSFMSHLAATILSNPRS